MFGWKPRDVLKMPARQLFCVMKNARKMKFEENAKHYYNFCSIAACGQADHEWITKLKTVYWNQFTPPLKSEDAGQRLTGLFKELENG